MCELFNPNKLLRTGNVCNDMGSTCLSTAVLWESILVFVFSGILYSGVNVPFSHQWFNFWFLFPTLHGGGRRNDTLLPHQPAEHYWRVGTRLQAFGYWYKCLIFFTSWVCVETCFVTWDLLKRRSQLFVPTFSGFWPKPLILWFLLELFFWFCRVFLGWWWFWGIYLGHSCRLKKDSHVHFMCVFFRALYFIMKVLLDFMRASV